MRDREERRARHRGASGQQPANGASGAASGLLRFVAEESAAVWDCHAHMAGRAAPIFAGTHELMSSRDCSSRRTTAPVASIQLIAGRLPFCVALWVAPLSATFTHF